MYPASEREGKTSGPGVRRMQNCSFIQQHKHCCAHKFIQSSSLQTRLKRGCNKPKENQGGESIAS